MTNEPAQIYVSTSINVHLLGISTANTSDESFPACTHLASCSNVFSTATRPISFGYSSKCQLICGIPKIWRLTFSFDIPLPLSFVRSTQWPGAKSKSSTAFPTQVVLKPVKHICELYIALASKRTIHRVFSVPILAQQILDLLDCSSPVHGEQMSASQLLSYRLPAIKQKLHICFPVAPQDRNSHSLVMFVHAISIATWHPPDWTQARTISTLASHLQYYQSCWRTHCPQLKCYTDIPVMLVKPLPSTVVLHWQGTSVDCHAVEPLADSHRTSIPYLDRQSCSGTAIRAAPLHLTSLCALIPLPLHNVCLTTGCTSSYNGLVAS